MGITLFYLMEDGTVEYTPMFTKKRDSQNNSYYDSTSINGNYETKRAITGVRDAIKLYTVNSYVESGGVSMTTIAATKDGSFYDLGILINN